MSAGHLPFSASFGGALSAADSGAVLFETEQSWQRVHHVLANFDWQECPLPGLLGLATYHYCVYKAFGQQPAASLVQRLFVRITTQWGELPARPSAWAASDLNQAQCFAWLSARFAAEGFARGPAPAQLAELDVELKQVAQRLCYHPQATSRSDFFLILRYFRIRLPLPDAGHSLYALLSLALPPEATIEQPGRPGWPEHVSLGLVDGLAAELLVLISLRKFGVQTSQVEHQVRRYIPYLLSIRRDVDFYEQRYSIFPYLVHRSSHKPSFGNKLNIQQGDLGQALLLHEVHRWLPDAELGRIAELVGLNTLLCTPGELTDITSSQLGHGTAGLAHLYGKLHRLAGHAAYRQGQHFWLAQTQNWVRQELATGFYLQRETDVLHGLVGVGLVLLSALAEEELGWDEMLI